MGPRFPTDLDVAVERLWSLETGVEKGVLWAGTAPAGLFKSTDDGQTWELNQGLWNHPTRPQWEPGGAGLSLHSICPWPDDPDRLAVATSAAGVWFTEDGGYSWEAGNRGLVSRYLPEEMRETGFSFCVHSMQRAPLQPRTLYMQFHGGAYRSDDAGKSWQEISSEGAVSFNFGFPVVVDPGNPDRILVIPLESDRNRVIAEGRLRVLETPDRGACWKALENGLPQEDAYLTVLRHAFCVDNQVPLGLLVGTTTGELFASYDDGATWRSRVSHLPPILSVRCS